MPDNCGKNSLYLILTDIPKQQWLRERLKMLTSTYIILLVNYKLASRYRPHISALHLDRRDSLMG
jgi:hypothetical protein